MDIMIENNIKFLTDSNGFKQDVVIPYNLWEKILEKINLKISSKEKRNNLLKNEYDNFFSDATFQREQIEMTTWFDNHDCETGQEW